MKAILTVILSLIIAASITKAQITLPIPISDVQGLSADLAQIEGQINTINNSLASLLSIVQIHGEIPAGAINGSNATFTLQNLPAPTASVAVYRNGIRQNLGGDYTISGSTITFLAQSVPLPGDVLLVDYQDPVPAYSHALTINHTLVAGSDLPYFPVYLVLNDPNLRTIANGGHVQFASGNDITFFFDSALKQPLPFEIVSYNPQMGTLTAVVRYPYVSHTVDTTFYIGYGSTAVAGFANPAAVWSAYFGVYHLEDNATNTTVLNSAAGNGQTTNATSVNNTSGMTTTGKLGAGLSFNGKTDGLDLGAYSVMNGATSLTFSGWVNFASLSQYATLISKLDPSTSAGSAITLSGNWTTSDQDWLTCVRTTSATSDTTVKWGIQTGVWYHFAYVYSQGAVSLYIDGAPVALTHYGPADASLVPTVMADLKSGYGANAVLDELRVSNQAFTPSWIATEYANESNPGAFVTFGAEVVTQAATSRLNPVR